MHKKNSRPWTAVETGAGEEARTLDLYLGKVSLYQLSYSRMLIFVDGIIRTHQIKKGSY